MISGYTRRHLVPRKYKPSGNGDGINAPAPVHYTIVGSESPDNFTAVGLPTGLSVNARTGKITGITTDVGDHNVTIKAGNFLGFSPEQILKINVKPIAPTLSSITDDLTATGVLGTSASINFKISDFGGQDCNVSVYYDSTDKGTVAGNWLHSKPSSGNLGTGSHNISLTGLTGATYHSGWPLRIPQELVGPVWREHSPQVQAQPRWSLFLMQIHRLLLPVEPRLLVAKFL